MVTIKDIAEVCGVSVATVSRALNGLANPENQHTMDILRKAQEMGYYPNSAARTLKTSRSNNIGIIYEDRMDHEFFSLLLNEVRFAAEDQGYDLTFIRRSSHYEAGTYQDRARRRNLDGVVVVQTDFTSADVMQLADSGFPTVVIDHVYEGCDCVMNDNLSAMEEIVRTVRDIGHTEIAFIHGEDGNVTRERIAGFTRSCREMGIAVGLDSLVAGHFHDPDSCSKSVRSLLATGKPPTCILCPDDFSCLGALSALQEMNIRVPEEISLIGFDGTRFSRMVSPRLATYRQNTEMIARTAVQLLGDAIDHPQEHIPRRIALAGTFIPGETLGPAYIRA